MTNKLFYLILFSSILLTLFSCKSRMDSNQLVHLADPFILLFEDTYFAYGTGASDGIEVMISKDLKQWSRVNNDCGGLALHKNDSYGDKWFWAPEVYYINDKFYMYYSISL